MKVGWEVKTLGDIADVKGGKRVPKGYKLQSEPTKHPYITVSDFTDDGTIDTSYIRYVSREVFDQIKMYTISSKDLYLSIAGTIGKTGYVPPELDGASLTENACKLVLRSGIDRDFIYYFTKSDDFTRQAGTNTRIAAQPKLSLERLKTIKLPIPSSLTEQQRIVGILSEAFEGIATAKANAEKNLQNARALFESHLQSVFTRRSDEVPLLRLASEITDGDHSPPPKAPMGVPFITISDIVKRTREVDFSNTFTVPAEYFLKLKPNKKPRVGDILYTVTGATLGIPVLVKEHRDFCFQRHIGLIRPNPDTDSAWLTYGLLSPQVFRQATIGSTGAAQKTVSLSVLRGLKLPKLALPEQKRIAARLDSLAAETHRLESVYQQKLAALDALKKSLLHQAFAGEL
jgi:type I restriction enzyme S subunit